tara:strand:- start:275 stop:667 length:393 start_codon:yes stop_codon:yes gene_type:complete
MKKLKVSQTRQELLENTIAFYSEDVTRRAFDEGAGVCMYHTADGRNCAIGRELKNPSTFGVATDSVDEGVGSLALMIELPKRLSSMGAYFLTDIQMLHDKDSYWDVDGLTDRGKGKVNSICIKYNLKNPL